MTCFPWLITKRQIQIKLDDVDGALVVVAQTLINLFAELEVLTVLGQIAAIQLQ